MNNVTIVTNYHWNDFIYGYELPESIKSIFDYLGEDLDNTDFIKYRGIYYDTGQFFRTCNDDGIQDKTFGSWSGYHSDSYFSGVLIRYSEDCEQYQIGTYYS